MDYTYHGVFERCYKFESGMSHTSEGMLLGGCFVSGFLVGACKTKLWCIMVVTECKVRCKMCNSVVLRVQCKMCNAYFETLSSNVQGICSLSKVCN